MSGGEEDDTLQGNAGDDYKLALGSIELEQPDCWLGNLEREGIREMCSWERFCTFAREPQKRKVGIDARIVVEGFNVFIMQC